MNPDLSPDQSAVPAAKPRRRRFRVFRVLFLLSGIVFLALLLAIFIPGLEFDHSLSIGGGQALIAKRVILKSIDGHNTINRSIFQAGPLMLSYNRYMDPVLPPVVHGGLFDADWRWRNWRLEIEGPSIIFRIGLKP